MRIGLTLLTNGGCRQNKTAKLPYLIQLEKKPMSPYEQLPTSRKSQIEKFHHKSTRQKSTMSRSFTNQYEYACWRQN